MPDYITDQFPDNLAEVEYIRVSLLRYFGWNGQLRTDLVLFQRF